MEEGTGDSNEDDTNVWLSYSKDGGHTYGNEISVSMGELGDYSKRLMWRRLGIARNWTFKLRTWTPNRVVLKALHIRPYGQ
jgi:Neuraminidase (sialidase)